MGVINHGVAEGGELMGWHFKSIRRVRVCNGKRIIIISELWWTLLPNIWCRIEITTCEFFTEIYVFLNLFTKYYTDNKHANKTKKNNMADKDSRWNNSNFKWIMILSGRGLVFAADENVVHANSCGDPCKILTFMGKNLKKHFSW